MMTIFTYSKDSRLEKELDSVSMASKSKTRINDKNPRKADLGSI